MLLIGEVTCIHASKHVVLYKFLESNGKSRTVIFVYGEPKVGDRKQVWDLLSSLLDSFSDSILIGDFNQLETPEDKSGVSLIITGARDIIDWRIRNNVVDVPFSDSRYTWSNKCLGK